MIFCLYIILILSSFLKDIIRVKSNGNIVSDETLRRMLWQNNNQITGDDSIEDMIRKSIGKFRMGDDEYAKLNQNTNTHILPDKRKDINLGYTANNAYIYKNPEYGTISPLLQFDIEKDKKELSIFMDSIRKDYLNEEMEM